MGLGLAKAKSEVWAYVQPGAVVGVTPGGIQGTVQPGAVTGIAPGGVLAAVQPGAVTGIEPGGITVNLSTGGALITGVIVIFASLYFLSLMPHEVTYLMILVVSALAVSNSKYFIIAAVTAFCLIATIISKTPFLVSENLLDYLPFVSLFLFFLLVCSVFIISEEQKKILESNQRIQELEKNFEVCQKSLEDKSNALMLTSEVEEKLQETELELQNTQVELKDAKTRLEDLRKQLEPGEAILRADRQLTYDQRIESPRKLFYLIMQSDCNLVAYRKSNGQAIWATNTVSSGAVRAVMQSDGNFVLYSGDGHAKWDSGTHGNGGAYFYVQDDGNLVIYSACGRVLWASSTVNWA